MVKVKWYINTGYPQAKHTGEWEFDEKEWEMMSEKTRTEVLDVYLQTEVQNHIDAGYYVVEGE